MKLINFRVKNFRSINDSGDISTEDLTAILGRNESGKSNLLLALQHLNPADGPTDLIAIKDFPRHRRLSEQNDDTEFLSTYWELSDLEQENLASILPRAEGVSTVCIRRDYKATRYVTFTDIKKKDFDRSAISRLLDKIIIIIDSEKTEDNKDVVDSAISNIEDLIPSSDISLDKWLESVKSTASNLLRTAAGYSGSKEDDFFELKEKFLEIIDNLDECEKMRNAVNYIASLIPVFVYIDEYPNLDGHQNLSSLKNKQNQGLPLDEFEKGFLKLCKVADLDPEQLSSLSSDSETRNQLVNRASAIVTQEIRRLWSDRKLKVRFNIDGSYFDTYISDPNSTYDVEVNLNERSRGFKWFFSFYISFFADTHGGNADHAIILLDEPGLYLHAKSQSDLLTHLDKDFTNQIIYTTHSPFLVPTKKLSSVKTVNISQEEGTVVTNDPTGDSTTIFPLQAALGYEVSQSLFIGTNNLVVEGITDFWYLSTMSDYLNSIGRVGLLPKITITPAGGAQKIPYLVSLLSSQHLNLIVLLDHEKEAIDTKKELISNYNMAKKNVILVSDAISSESVSELDIEDLMGSEYFIRLAEKAYNDDLESVEIIYNDNIPRVCKRFESALKRTVKKNFVKAKPARLFMNELSKGDVEELPDSLLDNFENLFKLINKRM